MTEMRERATADGDAARGETFRPFRVSRGRRITLCLQLDGEAFELAGGDTRVTFQWNGDIEKVCVCVSGCLSNHCALTVRGAGIVGRSMQRRSVLWLAPLRCRDHLWLSSGFPDVLSERH